MALELDFSRASKSKYMSWKSSEYIYIYLFLQRRYYGSNG